MSGWWAAAIGIGLAVGMAIGFLLGLVRRRRPERIAAPVSARLDSKPEGVGKRESKELSRSIGLLFDLAPDALMVFTDFGIIRAANPAAREMFFDGQDPTGKNFLRLLHQAPPALREQLLEETDRLFTIEVDHQHETYHLTRKEIDLDGEPHTLLAVKHMTREVRRREVETLERSIRIISHEVNNSLAPIASLVHSARVIADKPEHHQKLSKVLDTIEERALHLKGFLQGYARLARLPRPKPEEVSCAAILDHIRALYPEIVLPEPPDKKGFFDPTQVEQLLINLLKNAIEAGSKPAEVELTMATDDAGATRIEVLDRGQGLTEEALGNAILPLYTTKASGSGMGLALCREIVEAHSGELSLRNREGGGAVVRVTLSGKRAPDPALARSRAKLTLSRP